MRATPFLRWIVTVLGTLLAGATLTSCAKDEGQTEPDDNSRYAVPARDAWTGFDPSKSEAGAETLPNDRFTVVVDERQAGAQALLAERGWCVFTDE